MDRGRPAFAETALMGAKRKGLMDVCAAHSKHGIHDIAGMRRLAILAYCHSPALPKAQGTARLRLPRSAAARSRQMLLLVPRPMRQFFCYSIRQRQKDLATEPASRSTSRRKAVGAPVHHKCDVVTPVDMHTSCCCCCCCCSYAREAAFEFDSTSCLKRSL